jgi:hypothetical protein
MQSFRIIPLELASPDATTIRTLKQVNVTKATTPCLNIHSVLAVQAVKQGIFLKPLQKT